MKDPLSTPGAGILLYRILEIKSYNTLEVTKRTWHCLVETPSCGSSWGILEYSIDGKTEVKKCNLNYFLRSILLLGARQCKHSIVIADCAVSRILASTCAKGDILFVDPSLGGTRVVRK